ncbi:cysteine desulfurase family protein [Methyloradius palustris]|uniref:cysteine desulfurase n=1 Tax=Methyloradius palustris TaxID=2778876 RepID=A0A8D5G0M6_9PROT|nr:cysteine desulfurase family protein [Methyloradius palustris]BCM25667.1 cysteine desulfurase [Methyloradius palustris]
MTEAVYFDNNGTTALDSRVLEAMLPYMTAQPGNATSRHVFGRTARQAIERAREQVADATGAHPSQVIFTGSGTESDNMAIYGITAKNGHQKIAISAIEHPAVTRAAQALKCAGVKTETIAVDANSFVEQSALEELLAKNKLADAIGLISVMLANNETGVIQDIAKLAEIAKSQKAFIHTDAVQALGKMKVDFADLNVHAMSVSSHKINGPQGAGALILDKRVDIQPLLYGGGQEKGLRSGSENLAAIVGFGAACELVSRELIQRVGNVRQLRDKLEVGLKQLGAVIFGNQAERLANTSFFAFPNIEGETLVMALDRKGFAVASGSACSSDSTEPSHVLMAMGIDEDLARGSVRVSLANNNTSQQIEDFLLVLENELSRLRRLTAIAV